jgi:hypothetical protein
MDEENRSQGRGHELDLLTRLGTRGQRNRQTICRRELNGKTAMLACARLDE